jgi:hypothetical protein
MPITFDNHGWMHGALPEECIRECSVPGRDAQEFVTHWRRRLGFAPPEAQARAFLRGYGAWGDLDTASAETLADRVLWIFSCNAREAIERGEEPDYYLGM